MKKQISYTEPIPQFDDKGKRLADKFEKFIIVANNQEEFNAHMAAINDPTRGITDVVVSDLPPTAEELKAQMDEIDLRMIRPMGAIIAESATDDDMARFNELMEEKQQLRKQMLALGN